MTSSTPASAFGVTQHKSASVKDCWTIDHTSKAAGGADNGFLDCARSHTPGYMSHGTTAEAVNNLLGCFGVNTGTAEFVGHGNDGLIVTGQGQSPSDPDKFITTWNESRNWGPLVQRLRGKATIIKLWACHPGTGQPGADLLYAMMLRTNATCMGPTGFLYCGSTGFSLEANSTWQVASPGHPKPNPIAAPTPHFLVRFDQWALDVGNNVMIKLQDVISVEVTRDGKSLLGLHGDAAKGFLQLIEFNNPFQVDGVVGAIVTGHLIVSWNDDQGKSTSKRFIIYNNRLLQSEDDSSVYYRCSEGFGHALVLGIR